MKKSIYFILFILSNYLSFGQTPTEIVIKNINLITMTNDKVEKNQSILIRNKKIVQIDDFSKLKFGKKASVIDGVGKFLMPALTDMHIHLPAENKIEEALSLNIAAGVTRVRVMNSELHQLQVRTSLAKKPNLIAPKLYYSHIIRKENKFTPTQLDSLMLQIKKDKLSFIKLFSVGDEVTFDNIMYAANKHKITVCGHYPSKIAIDKVLNSGYKSIEHVGGLDAIADTVKLEEAIKLSQKNDTYHCPTLDFDLMAADLEFPDDYKKRLVFQVAPQKMLNNWETEYAQWVLENKGAENIIKNKNGYLPRFQNKQRILKKLNDANCNLLVGSDPGSYFQMAGFNMHEEMLNWSMAGIDNFSILKAATVNCARFFNEESQWGTIAKGMDGDLIILNKNPLENIVNIASITNTITKGKIFSKAEILNKL
jgi:imidazolonepropionase-like amidohydrolase